MNNASPYRKNHTKESIRDDQLYHISDRHTHPQLLQRRFGLITNKCNEIMIKYKNITFFFNDELTFLCSSSTS